MFLIWKVLGVFLILSKYYFIKKTKKKIPLFL